VALVSLVLAAGGAASAWFGAPWLRPGVVLVTSEPQGLEVSLDGQRTGQLTPAALENVLLSRPHAVTVSGAAVKDMAAPVPQRAGQLVARVHLRAPSSLGTLLIESVPAGAEVVLDDRPVGRTPATLAAVRLDQRHRVDLVLAGHEIDQFVVLPDKDGVRFARRLAKLEPRAKPPPAAPSP
jgi:eukaryotic-like serine/threonine-protein kinase